MRAPERTTPGGLVLVAVLLVGLNLRGAIAAVSPVLPDLRADLGMSPATAGLLTSLPVLCFALGAPLSAWLGRVVGTHRAVLLGCAIIAAVTLVRPYGNAWLLLAGTVVVGLAMTIGNVLLPVVVKRDFRSAAGRVTGVVTASLAAGAALTAALTAPLAVWLGWRHALAVWALVAILAAAVWWVAAHGGDEAAPAAVPAAGAPGRLWRSPVAWAVTAFLGLQSVTYYAVTAWLPSLLREQANLGLADAGLAMSLFQVLGIPGTLLVPLWVHRRRDQRALGIGIAIGWLITVLGLVAAPGLWLAWCVLGGVVQGMGISYAFTILVLRSADDLVARRMSAMMQLLGYIVGAAGPFVVGLLHGATGSWAVAMAPVAVSAVGLALAALVAGSNRVVRV